MSVSIPITAPNAYADHEDLTNYWKAPDSETRADYMLKLSSNRLRQIALDVGIDLDADVNASEVYFINVQSVVMEATKRALQAPLDQQPTETYGQTAGPYSENFKYSNPAGDLYFKKAELKLLGLYGTQSLDSISTNIVTGKQVSSHEVFPSHDTRSVSQSRYKVCFPVTIQGLFPSHDTRSVSQSRYKVCFPVTIQARCTSLRRGRVRIQFFVGCS